MKEIFKGMYWIQSFLLTLKIYTSLKIYTQEENKSHSGIQFDTEPLIQFEQKPDLYDFRNNDQTRSFSTVISETSTFPRRREDVSRSVVSQADDMASESFTRRPNSLATIWTKIKTTFIFNGFSSNVPLGVKRTQEIVLNNVVKLEEAMIRLQRFWFRLELIN